MRCCRRSLPVCWLHVAAVVVAAAQRHQCLTASKTERIGESKKFGNDKMTLLRLQAGRGRYGFAAISPKGGQRQGIALQAAA